jgi:hypothetical protein
MSLDLFSMNNDDFDDWMRNMQGRAPGDDLSEERLVELVSATLREVKPEARARSFVDLANMCYAMADKTLGSQAPLTNCLEVVVSVGQRH